MLLKGQHLLNFTRKEILRIIEVEILEINKYK